MPKQFLYYFSFFLLVTVGSVKAQDSAALAAQKAELSRRADSIAAVVRADSLRMADSIAAMVQADSIRIADSIAAAEAYAALPPSEKLDYRDAYWKTVRQHPAWASASSEVLRIPMEPRNTPDKDDIFYLLCGLLFYLGLLRSFFPKYFQDLFRIVFQNTSFRQKQLREQMMQAPLASLMLNLFFVMVGGVFISFLLQYYERVLPGRFWILTGMCTAAVAILYLLKFIVLKLMGWIFAISEALDTYSFIVFLINKITGLALLPLLILIAFAVNGMQTFAVNLAVIVVALLFLYRYVLAWSTAAREVKVSRFHFFLYLCAFEIAPLLLIYRGLSIYV